MKLLKDDELVPLVNSTNSILPGHGYNKDWYASNSPVQPASIDMTIGDIFLPGATRTEDGGEAAPVSSYYLKPGQTAIVATQEMLRLPANLAAFGFPPAHVSSKGLLMTNPGHVDPGYDGALRFTIINMGSKPYLLKRRAPIVTLLVVELSGDCHADWRSRGNSSARIRQNDIDVLSADFLQVDQRAKDITEKAVTEAGWRATLVSASVSAIVPILVAVLGISNQMFPGFFTPQWRWTFRRNWPPLRRRRTSAKRKLAFQN